MCDTCGCNLTHGNAHLAHAPQPAGATAVSVLKGLLSANDLAARHNRAHFDAHEVLAVNLMSSPGAGKTRLIEATIDALRDTLRIAVIEGDLETENDAERVRAKGVSAHQITTGTACHLDAHMVHDALHRLKLDGIDLVFIENVGNLVCPEEDVYQAIQLALNEDVILVAFGDMLRVPVNAPRKDPRSLEQARAAGADIHPIASPSEAVRIARENPEREVVFFAAGFETTTAPVAAMLAEGAPAAATGGA